MDVVIYALAHSAAHEHCTNLPNLYINHRRYACVGRSGSAARRYRRYNAKSVCVCVLLVMRCDPPGG